MSKLRAPRCSLHRQFGQALGLCEREAAWGLHAPPSALESSGSVSELSFTSLAGGSELILSNRWRGKTASHKRGRGCVPQNLTCGGVLAATRSDSSSSKNSLDWNPIIPAISTAGNHWMAALYSDTELLKKRRAAAILFSRSAAG